MGQMKLGHRPTIATGKSNHSPCRRGKSQILSIPGTDQSPLCTTFSCGVLMHLDFFATFPSTQLEYSGGR
jgi:hypothetical protein